MVARARAFQVAKSPSRNNIKRYKNWFYNTKPLNGRENNYLEHGYDYIALSDRQEAGRVDAFIAGLLDEHVLTKVFKKVSTLHWFNSALTYMLISLQRSEVDWESLHKVSDNYLRYRSGTRTFLCVKSMMTTSVVLLLIGPSAILYLVSGVCQLVTCGNNVYGQNSPTLQQSALKLLLIAGCVGVFCLLLNVTTYCRYLPH